MADRISLDAIEADWESRRSRAADLSGAAVWALEQFAASPPLLEAAAALAEQAEEHSCDEPPYHDRHHFVEATLAMASLCRIACDDGMLSTEDAALGVLAMIGHDLGHDGSMTGGGILERRAWALMHPCLTACGIGPADCATVEAVVLATDPALTARNAAALNAQPSPHNLLCAFSNEADVFGSMLPSLGQRLSVLIAAEWGNRAVYTTRDRFLRGVPPFSAASSRMGLTAARQLSLAVLSEAGLATLDAMRPDQADRHYRAVLARLISR